MELDNTEPLALTTSQLLKRLRISRSALYKFVKEGRIVALPHFKRNKLFAYSEILRFLETPKKIHNHETKNTNS